MICLLLLEPLEVSFVDENGVNKADYSDGEVGLHIIFHNTQEPHRWYSTVAISLKMSSVKPPKCDLHHNSYGLSVKKSLKVFF